MALRKIIFLFRMYIDSENNQHFYCLSVTFHIFAPYKYYNKKFCWCIVVNQTAASG